MQLLPPLKYISDGQLVVLFVKFIVLLPCAFYVEVDVMLELVDDVEFVVDDLVVLDVDVLFVVEVKLVFVDEVVLVEVVTRNTHAVELHDMQPSPNASAQVVVQLPLVVHV